MAIVTYNDNGTIKVVKYGNSVVSTDAVGELYEFYKVTNSEYSNANFKVDISAPEGASPNQIMNIFRTQHSQYYEDLDQVYHGGLVVRANEDGYTNTYWKLRLR